jgi:hypothetical protein
LHAATTSLLSHTGHGDEAGTRWDPKPDGVTGLVKMRPAKLNGVGMERLDPAPNPVGATPRRVRDLVRLGKEGQGRKLGLERERAG